MKIEVRKVGPNKEVKIYENGIFINIGMLDGDECVELAKTLAITVVELLE